MASLQDIAVLEITSRHFDSASTYSKVLKSGSVQCFSLAESPLKAKGTVMSVHDIFHNLPVRRTALNPALEVDSMKWRIEGLALINPGLSITLVDTDSGLTLLSTPRSAASCKEVFGCLHGEAMMSSLREVSEHRSPIFINGFISIRAHRNTTLQVEIKMLCVCVCAFSCLFVF